MGHYDLERNLAWVLSEWWWSGLSGWSQELVIFGETAFFVLVLNGLCSCFISFYLVWMFKCLSLNVREGLAHACCPHIVADLTIVLCTVNPVYVLLRNYHFLSCTIFW